MTEFTHLHVHSEFSLLHASIRVKALAQRAAELGMKHVALTDHVNLYGAIAFFDAARAAGVAPIIGAELNILPPAEHATLGKELHLVALAETQEGYRNLLALISKSWIASEQHQLPALTLEALGEHAEGIVFLTACMGGYVAQSALHFGQAGAETALAQLKAVIPNAEAQLFVELQSHGYPEQAPLNRILSAAAKRAGLRCVATNDCHYLRPEDARAHRALQCIHSGQRLSELGDIPAGQGELYLKDAASMASAFAQYPEALATSVALGERCGGKVTPYCDPQLPRFETPNGEEEGAYLRLLSLQGLEARLADLRAQGQAPDEHVYEQRLERELGVIESMGFPGYFLIVADFINWAKAQGIPVGPGRGSGAGSLVAYVLRITDLDPIFHGLLFERFLNPERVSMPDFDVDFCVEGRDRVIHYVRERYGQLSVAQIATFHQLKSRSVVRDIARVMGMTPAEGGRVAMLVPEPVQGKTVSIAKALEQEPRLKALQSTEPAVAELLETAQALEDLTRHAGMHAAGVVISPGELWDFVPVFCPEPGELVTHFHKDDVEKAGLVKFDFLGLKTLTVIDIALRLVNARPERQANPLRLDVLPMDDKGTFALLSSGETTNVFQLESTGMQGLFKQLKPDAFEDIVAAVALYRPGPLGSGMVEDFIQRKHGLTPVSYPHPDLEPVLKDTYGVIVYQEQVMQIAQVMGGYSLGGADLLRRAMGKKKAEEMAKQKQVFLEGAQKLGYRTEDADRVFELMAYFAGYGFNKSHSAAYALITYQTAYLKAHYPAEFMCATLTSDKEKQEKVVRTVNEAKAMGLVVLPPDVNESNTDFTVAYDSVDALNLSDPQAAAGAKNAPSTPPSSQGARVRFGLGAIKGVGSAAVDAIFEARQNPECLPSASQAPSGPATRQAELPFLDLFDFTERVDLRRVSKNVIESLVQCGAFDTVHEALSIDRASALASIDKAVETGKKKQAEKASGQTSLFDMAGDDSMDAGGGTLRRALFVDAASWSWKEHLEREKASLGFYVSGHPMSIYQGDAERLGCSSLEMLSRAQDGQDATVACIVESFRERTTRSGARIAFGEAEDTSGRLEIVARGRLLKDDAARELLANSSAPLLLRGSVQIRDEEAKDDAPRSLVVQEVTPLAEGLLSRVRRAVVSLSAEEAARGDVEALKRTLARHPGPTALELRLIAQDWRVELDLSPEIKVEASEALKLAIQETVPRALLERFP